ncbi:MAG: hypothetical protein KBS91_00790, partial [Firmicutes bacterium]|nr:hypothetical protein [Candidatus Caballimonas caccae]
MKKFSIKYTPLILTLLIICLLICLSGVVLSFIRILNPNNMTLDTVKFSILAFLNLFLVLFTISVLAYGKYT